MNKTCLVPLCNRHSTFKDNFCHKHHQYYKRHGFPEIIAPDIYPLPITNVQASWLAALIDGEGTVAIFKNIKKGDNCASYPNVVAISNTNKELLEEVKKVTSLGKIVEISPERKDIRCKTVYAWRIFKHVPIHQLLLAIFPFLIVKKKQATLMLNLPVLHEINPKKREEIYQQMKTLNKRGI